MARDRHGNLQHENIRNNQSLVTLPPVKLTAGGMDSRHHPLIQWKN